MTAETKKTFGEIYEKHASAVEAIQPFFSSHKDAVHFETAASVRRGVKCVDGYIDIFGRWNCVDIFGRWKCVDIFGR